LGTCAQSWQEEERQEIGAAEGNRQARLDAVGTVSDVQGSAHIKLMHRYRTPALLCMHGASNKPIHSPGLTFYAQDTRIVDEHVDLVSLWKCRVRSACVTGAAKKMKRGKA